MIEEKKDDKHSESGNDTKPIVRRCIVHNCEECPMFYDGRKSNDHDRLICNHPNALYQLSTPLEPIPKVSQLK